MKGKGKGKVHVVNMETFAMKKITFLYLHVNKQGLSQYYSDKLQREKNP